MKTLLALLWFPIAVYADRPEKLMGTADSTYVVKDVPSVKEKRKSHLMLGTAIGGGLGTLAILAAASGQDLCPGGPHTSHSCSEITMDEAAALALATTAIGAGVGALIQTKTQIPAALQDLQRTLLSPSFRVRPCKLGLRWEFRF